MRVLLRFELDCEPDAAWRAIRSPAVMRRVASPFLAFASLEENGFPDLWGEGPHVMAVRALGLVDLGEQVIDLRHRERRGARIQHDSGLGLTGALTVVTRWEHSMAISATGDGRTLYRDQLRFAAGPATVALWPAYWLFWQWRAHRIRGLASSWR
ncbi:hypothetical protein QT381_00885 [Galbitalea sp. SE-J8]|uniref:hypothetical protein n=1 Tax=Galbitalea sp. SE-J8 TaxID=3054952 RepID=UPI00259CC1C2|nr:hypothetical protein [Galbitalea sp. SE-J8]MDM4761563.1 hypothetical protein [Galbitalea sp. SE-J8]